MILSRRVALGGVQLDEIHDAIVIRSIDAGVPHENIQAVNRMGGFGQRITGQHWENKEVQVTFAINANKKDFALRRELWDAVINWALRGGWLTTNEVPGRRMYVDKTVLPNIGDLWEWTSDYTLTFRAYGIPFWQDETPVTAGLDSVSNGRVLVDVPGHFQTVADVNFQNISGATIPNIRIGAGSNTIELRGVNLTASETLKITHGTDGILKIMAGSRNVYGKRTAASADDLFLDPGTGRAVSVNADRAGKLTVNVFGRYA